MIWKSLLRPLLFRWDAERAHYLSMGMFSTAASIPPLGWAIELATGLHDARLKSSHLGMTFPHPVGLAAGFDKGARWFNSLSRLGFSSIEVGTVTAHAQDGNPQPRLFRLPADQALLNRMGFNNAGAQAVAHHLKGQTIRPILGINIGKSKITPLDLAADDYTASLELLFPFADYWTVNVSSPNTPGLRELQGREPLSQLLTEVNQKNRQLAEEQGSTARPVLLKIAPDLSWEALDEIVEIAKEQQLAGLIATNTTISRDALNTPIDHVTELGAGGVSGRPLTSRSREVVAHLYRRVEGSIPIVGVGGLMDGADVVAMIEAGASLVQCYTGFIYGGPFFVKQVLRSIVGRLDELGVESIDNLVGRANR